MQVNFGIFFSYFKFTPTRPHKYFLISTLCQTKWTTHAHIYYRWWNIFMGYFARVYTFWSQQKLSYMYLHVVLAFSLCLCDAKYKNTTPSCSRRSFVTSSSSSSSYTENLSIFIDMCVRFLSFHAPRSRRYDATWLWRQPQPPPPPPPI